MAGGDASASFDEGAIDATHRWAADMLRRLEKNDPLGKLFAVNQDILGAYFYRDCTDDEFAVNPAHIVLYWCVIGLVAQGLGCSVEDLTVVVMTHELAHAYTQLGADIEGRRWPSRDFAQAELALKEGLAQFYTVRALQRLQLRVPSAVNVFKDLLAKQAPEYHAHEPWVEQHSPEAVRQALIEVRRWRERGLSQFTERVGGPTKPLSRPAGYPNEAGGDAR